MKSRRVYNVSWLFTFLPVLLFLCFAAKPLQAEEPLSKESATEELPSAETPPTGYGKISDRLMLIAHFSAFYTLSDLHGSDTLSGGAINGLLAPTYKFDDRKFLILMYDGQYYRRREFYSDDIGPRERSEFQRHTITPMVRIDFGKEARYSITPSFFHTVTYNKDIEPGGWRDGLYNYRDVGAGVDFDMRKLGYGGGDGALKLGVQYYRREYPNYTSLLDLAAGIGIEEDEKDYHGVITRARYNWTQKTGFSWGAEYFLLYKDLDDKKVVRSDGVLSSTEQHDYLHSLDLMCWYIIDEIDGRLRLGLDLNSSQKDSNQNYYDGMGTLTLADDVFLPDFYDYCSYRIRPNVSYTLALLPLTTSLSYAYQKADYTDRRARHRTGVYKTDKQWETLEEIELEFRYDLTDNWGLLALWQRIIGRSNNDDESVYQYDYKIANYSVGVSYKF